MHCTRDSGIYAVHDRPLRELLVETDYSWKVRKKIPRPFNCVLTTLKLNLKVDLQLMSFDVTEITGNSYCPLRQELQDPRAHSTLSQRLQQRIGAEGTGGPTCNTKGTMGS